MAIRIIGRPPLAARRRLLPVWLPCDVVRLHAFPVLVALVSRCRRECAPVIAAKGADPTWPSCRSQLDCRDDRMRVNDVRCE
eukprot:scaffold321596_cov27-Tisochrysis_lutea.AAC.1